MPALLGIGGANRNACAAVCVDGELRAACEQERLNRVRGVGADGAMFPTGAIDEVLTLAGMPQEDVATCVVAEEMRGPRSIATTVVDHHLAHAATAFLTSPFDRAVVLVCDSHPGRELSVWTTRDGRLADERWPWQGRALATLYSECTEVFGLSPHRQEHLLEGLAHLAQGSQVDELRDLFRYVDGTIQVEPCWRERIVDMISAERCRRPYPVETASAVQRRLGELLLDILADIRATCEPDLLCLGGGLFYNTYLTTLALRSGGFRDVFVPINPGNAGIAVGAALLVAAEHRPANATPVSPFLGREYDAETIKETLDGCKLSYAFVSEREAIDAAVDALGRGQLVGWFQGRMEWGPRALGHRSILADPGSPYVLENLNGFLRKREPWRSFGVSVCEDAVRALLCGPHASRFMEYEYQPKDDRFQHVMPAGARSLRVQTVSPDIGPFWTLHKRMQEAGGTGALVNTSFNGFREPIACSPRDAVRVFYGTGLDLLVIGGFLLRK